MVLWSSSKKPTARSESIWAQKTSQATHHWKDFITHISRTYSTLHLVATDFSAKNLVTSSLTSKFYDQTVSLATPPKMVLELFSSKNTTTTWSDRFRCSFSDAEQNYCPLERKTLTIVFTCERFHDYAYGRHFEVLNDHLPLKSISNKPLSKSPAHLQCFRLRLQRYDFTVNYHSGSWRTLPTPSIQHLWKTQLRKSHTKLWLPLFTPSGKSFH